MTTDEAIKFFTKKGLYKALKLRSGRQTVAAWGERPPLMRQYQIECLSCGHLLADDYAERRQLKPPKPHPYEALAVPGKVPAETAAQHA